MRIDRRDGDRKSYIKQMIMYMIKKNLFSFHDFAVLSFLITKCNLTKEEVEDVLDYFDHNTKDSQKAQSLRNRLGMNAKER